MNTKPFLCLLMAWLMAMPVAAQIEEDRADDENTADSIVAGVDTLHVNSLLPWPQSLQAKLEQLLKTDMFETSQVALMVYDLDADSAIFRRNERQLMRPASTMKILTAVTALDRLGGSHQFKTELCYTGKIENQTLSGDVYCVGGFDPRFNTDDMNAFVESLQKMGVDTIRGTIYADKSMVQGDSLGRGWCWDDDNPVLSPLLFARKNIFIERFVQHLRKVGIVVEASISAAQRPQEAMCICMRFHTMDQILMRMMKESDNLYAEAMLYQIAASTGNNAATARHAASVMQRLINKLGLKATNYRLADGSGLSLYNYVSAELETQFLRYAFRNANIYLHLLPSLPIAGIDGTLKNRMKGAFTRGNVRAKTGTLTGVYSLAGYCTASNGRQLCFVILNQGVMHGRNARRFQDSVCRILVE